MRIPAIRRTNRRREEVLQFENAARGYDVFIRCHAADRAFVHFDDISDVAQHQGLEEASRLS